jgi:hypothetical protein
MPATHRSRTSAPAAETSPAVPKTVPETATSAAADPLTAGSAAGEDWSELRPYVINLDHGKLSADSLYPMRPADLEAIFAVHLPAYWEECRAAGRIPRLVLYAHGGLVEERAGLQTARLHTKWWRDNHVFPLYFVWHTGFLEVLADWLREALGGGPGAAPVAAEFDVARELGDPVVEFVAHRYGGVQVWDRMKQSATLAFAAAGDGTRTLQRLLEWLQSLPAGEPKPELHAVGHSAGAVFHAALLPTLRSLSGSAAGPVKRLLVMAPAVTIAQFRRLLLPLIGPGQAVEGITVFTMDDPREQHDVCPLGHVTVYHKSLLYLIFRALEPARREPLLGLQSSLIHAETDVRTLLGLGAATGVPSAGQVFFSPTAAAEGRGASRATAHGAFQFDRSTMESLLRWVADLSDSDPLAERFPVVPEAIPAEEALAPVAVPEAADALAAPALATAGLPLPAGALSSRRTRAAASLLRALADYLEANDSVTDP